MSFLKKLLGTQVESGPDPTDRRQMEEELKQWAIVSIPRTRSDS